MSFAQRFAQGPNGLRRTKSSCPNAVSWYPSRVLSTIRASLSSLSRLFRMDGEIVSHEFCRLRKVPGPRLKFQIIPIAHRLPSKSKIAIIGAPDFEPRTGCPGRGIAMIRALPLLSVLHIDLIWNPFLKR